MSFRRAVAPSTTSAPPGTRRWLDGALLVSTGLASLDTALGGGVPLGSLVLIEEDARGGKLAHTLASLFAAESLAAGHNLITAGADGRGGSGGADAFLNSLPFCSSSGSADAAARAADAVATLMLGLDATTPTPVPSQEDTNNKNNSAADDEVIVEDGNDDDDDDSNITTPTTMQLSKGHGLSSSYAASAIAAMAASAADSSSTRGSNNNFCHTFDLSRRTTISYLTSLRTTCRLRALQIRGVNNTSAFAAIELLRSLNLSTSAITAASRITLADLLLKAQAVALKSTKNGSESSSSLPTTSISALTDVGILTIIGALIQATANRAQIEGCPYTNLWEQLAPLITSSKETDAQQVGAASTVVTRVVLYGLGGIAWPGCTGNDAARTRIGHGNAPPILASANEHKAAQPLITFFTNLAKSLSKGRLSTSPSVAFVVVPTWALPSAVSASLRARAAVVLKLHGVGDPAYALGGGGGGGDTYLRIDADALEPAIAARGFPRASGVLLIRRLPLWGHATPQTNIGGDELVVTRERRKITLEKPHPPPEDIPTDGAALPCASSGGNGGKSIVDF